MKLMIDKIDSRLLDKAVDFCSGNAYAELDAIGIDRKKLYEKRLHSFISNSNSNGKGKSKDAYYLYDQHDPVKAMLGIVLFEKLDFDTHFFKTESFRITDLVIGQGLDAGKSSEVADLLADFALKEMKKQGGKFIQAKLESRSDFAIKALHKKGFFTASEDVTLYKNLDPAPAGKNSPGHEGEREGEKEREGVASGNVFLASPATEADIPALYEISKEAYKTTRFHQDPNIKPEDADEMQGQWIRNCHFQKLSDDIIVIKKQGSPVSQVAGYVACSMIKDDFLDDKKVGRIVLIAAHKDHRGTGVGRVLVEESDRWFLEHGCSGVAVGTQMINSGAMKYYQKNGFEVIGTTQSLHRWL